MVWARKPQRQPVVATRRPQWPGRATFNLSVFKSLKWKKIPRENSQQKSFCCLIPRFEQGAFSLPFLATPSTDVPVSVKQCSALILPNTNIPVGNLFFEICPKTILSSCKSWTQFFSFLSASFTLKKIRLRDVNRDPNITRSEITLHQAWFWQKLPLVNWRGIFTTRSLKCLIPGWLPTHHYKTGIKHKCSYLINGMLARWITWARTGHSHTLINPSTNLILSTQEPRRQSGEKATFNNQTKWETHTGRKQSERMEVDLEKKFS